MVCIREENHYGSVFVYYVLSPGKNVHPACGAKDRANVKTERKVTEFCYWSGKEGFESHIPFVILCDMFSLF